MINIYEPENRTKSLINRLLAVWENSVKATHLFLSDREISQIKEYVPMALAGVEHLLVAENNDGTPTAFMGIDNAKIEMLFIAPEERGKGLGKKLILKAIEDFKADEVTVNEQNPQAVGFYRHMGFETYKRSEIDEQGNPYPILYMRLDKK